MAAGVEQASTDSAK